MMNNVVKFFSNSKVNMVSKQIRLNCIVHKLSRSNYLIKLKFIIEKINIIITFHSSTIENLMFALIYNNSIFFPWLANNIIF